METVTLYRPVGRREAELIVESGYRAFPPRLPEQPIFYPVLSFEYADQIARDWNTKDPTSGYVGIVTCFRVEKDYAARFETHVVGLQSVHQELWVPAEELDEFNRHIVGQIEFAAVHYGPECRGEVVPTGDRGGEHMSSARANDPVEYLPGSEELVGYRTKIRHKPAFRITGYTRIVPPRAEGAVIPDLVREVMAAGGLEALAATNSVRPWILGLGSWDEECEPGGQRYTICVEETEGTDLSGLRGAIPLHTQAFEACDWMCFEMPHDQLWRDDPYTMLKQLGYRFHLRVGVHFDAFPPDYDEQTNPGVELWISVAKPSEECDVCSVREQCAGIQAFA